MKCYLVSFYVIISQYIKVVYLQNTQSSTNRHRLDLGMKFF